MGVIIAYDEPGSQVLPERKIRDSDRWCHPVMEMRKKRQLAL
jgi:hypothetical protein